MEWRREEQSPSTWRDKGREGEIGGERKRKTDKERERDKEREKESERREREREREIG